MAPPRSTHRSVIEFCEQAQVALLRRTPARSAGVCVVCTFWGADPHVTMRVELETNICGDWMAQSSVFDGDGGFVASTEGLCYTPEEAVGSMRSFDDESGEIDGSSQVEPPFDEYTNVTVRVEDRGLGGARAQLAVQQASRALGL